MSEQLPDGALDQTDQTDQTGQTDQTDRTGRAIPSVEPGQVRQPDRSSASGPSVPEVRVGSVRRAPRYGAFLASGAVVGVFLALVSGLLGTGDGTISRSRLIGYLVITLGLIGTLLGGAVAVLIERFSRPPTPRTIEGRLAGEDRADQDQGQDLDQDQGQDLGQGRGRDDQARLG